MGMFDNLDAGVWYGIGVAVLCTLISWIVVGYMSYKSFFVKRDAPTPMGDDQIDFLMRRCQRKRVGEVSEINIYPLKSAAQHRVKEAEVTGIGLKNDRGFMVMDLETKIWVSQRENSKMATIGATVSPKGQLTLTCDANKSQQPLVIVPKRGKATAEAMLWESPVPAVDQGDEAAAWLSKALDQKVRLVCAADGFEAATGEDFAKGFQTGLADGFPYHLITEASVDALNKKISGEPVSTKNFRPNIVVKGCGAWQEDQWSIYRVGEVLFQNVKPCCRCRVTGVDPATGEDAKFQSLAALTKYRKGRALGVGPWGEGQVFFGQNAVAHNPGTIKVGDVVEVLVFENWDKLVGARTDLTAESLGASAI